MKTLVNLYTIFWIYVIVCWIINLIQLFNCDFDSPYKDEFIKFVGLLIVPVSGITVWF